MWTTRTATGRSWLGGEGLGERCFVVAGVGAWEGDLVLDLREGVCCVLCVFVRVCVSPLEGLRRGRKGDNERTNMHPLWRASGGDGIME